MGLKSGFRVTPDAGFERAIEIDFLFGILIFEVPILGPRMRGLPRYFYFLMFFKRTSNMRNTTCSSILVGLQSELSTLPSDTLLELRVGDGRGERP